MSFGLVPICEILRKKEVSEEEKLYDLYIIPFGEFAEITSLELANKLREQGIRIIIEMNKKKIKKCFEWANKKNIPFVTVIGEDEINNQTISIKNMESGETTQYQFNEIDKFASEFNDN